MPLLVGLLGDSLGLRTAMSVVYLTLGFIFSIAFWARPLVRNETMSFKALLASLNPARQRG